ncbi:O-antigen ligase family protein [Microbacterium sp. zg.Y625]|uniref:O-antigen ligase family protein n=1 Tax=Microbacterium jiangjiandongii TaxID=3049071 RepID=UPI00214CDD76|nr:MULTISPECIES: O-antigen ligase family protein [unclassified Microbacterium]MCR2793562.1 O-antigen ligase family protein [Microbacterium sp. zg.Y625]WIM25916.1 O-antigen ligase family protein [Microbacterium sp. zg-Y625]
MVKASRGGSALTMVTVYLVLLIAVPSNLTITALGSLGRPSLLWGLLLMMWWTLARLQQRNVDVLPVRQPVRLALGCLVVVVLVSFAFAMLRGQPADQVSPAIVSLLRLMSWSGVLLVVMDGIRTHHDAAKLHRRIVGAGVFLAVLGLCQFFAGQTLLGWVAALPGVSMDLGGVDTRGMFTRASGTATHPLEYTAAITAILPLALAHGLLRGPRSAGGIITAWLPATLLALAALLSVSRSAVIGIAVAFVAFLPGMPRGYRMAIGVGGAVAAAAVVIVVPGMLSTTLSLFTQASGDPSTQSRTNALARVPEFLATSPLVGQGFGTFLPRYYIFDNQWVLTTVELGVLGVASLLAMVGCAVVGAARAGRFSRFPDTRLLGSATAASTLTIAVLLLFFDGLSFPIAAGLMFLLIGYASALRAIGRADSDLALRSRARALPGVGVARRRAIPTRVSQHLSRSTDAQ